jgi:hypothetical protein
MNGTGLRSCLTVDVGIGSVEPSGSGTVVLVNWPIGPLINLKTYKVLKISC